MSRPARVAPTLDTRTKKIADLVAKHRRRLGEINEEYEQAVRTARLRASDLRREENARYRMSLEEAKA